MSVSLNAVIDLEQAASALAELAGENEVLQAKAMTDKTSSRASTTASGTRRATRSSAMSPLRWRR
jgi:hypothetical protein